MYENSFPAGVPQAEGPVTVPSKSEVRAVIADHCFERSTSRSLGYALFSLAATLIPGVLAWQFLPMTWAFAPVWVLYAVVVGTAAVGVWVVAHECGHDAFSSNRFLQDSVGFVLHSALLVPYFSWQRSHAIHHAKTNHVVDGETHVPKKVSAPGGKSVLRSRQRFGRKLHTGFAIFIRLTFGWPMYLLLGTTGGTERGTTNHFWPFAPFSKSLFPDRWVSKVLWSAAGVIATLALLALWAVAAGSVVPVLALYVGPYLVVNAWLVTYTWLHHTSPDTPHFEGSEWSYVRGAFCSIDRPYGALINLVHHNIGSTHAVHHLFSRVPHYHAVEATEAVRDAFPDFYRFDPTPVPVALWQTARECVAVAPVDTGAGQEWRYVERV